MQNNPATETGTKIENAVDQKLSKTYKELAGEFVNNSNIQSTDEIAGVMMFAEHLDGNNVMTDQLTILAIMQARKIDRETILALVDEIGLERSKVIIRGVVNNHRHTKICQDEAVQANDEKKSADEQSDAL